MKVIALDLGTRRIGVAVSDATGTLASPRGVIEVAGDPSAHRAAVAELVKEVGAERVVVGLPLSLDGREGPAAVAARAEAEAIATLVDVPVELVDERFTTVTAHRALAATGMKERRRRQVVDETAAAEILQGWLDERKRRG